MHNHPPTPKLRVVVIDDNRDAADALALVLQLKGCEVRVAYDGAAGLAAARECAPDCLISDIGMPGMDGYMVARGVRQDPTLAGVMLVALSAYSHEDHVRKAREAGYDYQVTKSSSLTELEEVLRMIEDIRSLARQSVELAGETRDLLAEVKEDIAEVKQEVRELRQEIRELKEDRETAGGTE